MSVGQTERRSLGWSDNRTDSATVGRSCRRVSRLDWQRGLTKGVGPSNEQQIDGRSVGRKDVLTGSPHTDRGGTVGWSARACVECERTDGRKDGRWVARTGRQTC